ncbi:molybdenum cofactor guanylyltransferase [Desertivirga arenae]|uniref:molybdenum cofactor guanylyltransferase n=1 Tax=Desertivirga arenae TaxID=2810309 RepID=UPI001A979C4B|nr:NTP transferase domain-containing protein [Pedobacter sp. SYSU D00823]
MSNLIGVILCGGESKRMGRDKGLIEQNGKHWAVLIAEKLRQLELPVVVSINKKQQDAYDILFPDTPLIVDKLTIKGPLNGLLTIHENFPDKDILLMATDLIDMDDKTLKELLEVYQNETGFEFYAYDSEGFAQSFCSIFTAAGLKKVFERFMNNELKKYSLHDRFNEGKTRFIPLSNIEAFNNYNNL